MERVAVAVLRIDPVGGKPAAEAVGPLVHRAHGVDDRLAAHARPLFGNDRRDRAAGRDANLSFPFHCNTSEKEKTLIFAGSPQKRTPLLISCIIVRTAPFVKSPKKSFPFFEKGVDICALRRYNAQKGNGVFGQCAQRPFFILVTGGNGVFCAFFAPAPLPFLYSNQERMSDL